MSVKLLTEQHLQFLFLIIKGGCTGSSESTHIKCNIVGNRMSRLKCLLFTLFSYSVFMSLLMICISVLYLFHGAMSWYAVCKIEAFQLSYLISFW